jgi:hypothetical protein
MRFRRQRHRTFAHIMKGIVPKEKNWNKRYHKPDLS